MLLLARTIESVRQREAEWLRARVTERNTERQKEGEIYVLTEKKRG